MLRVNDLETNFNTKNGTVKAVRSVDVFVNKGEMVSIVGESGCGKTTLALSIMRLIDPPGTISGTIHLNDINIMELTEHGMQKVRGSSISMIFQDPFSSLNPVISIGEQISEVVTAHDHMDKKSAKKRAIELLNMVSIDDPEKRYGEYPHQFSGGMKQRIMIAIAIASRPQFLIADEPTTALDVIIGKEIMDLLVDLKDSLQIGILLITHNLALASEYSERFYVMYAGLIMEEGSREEVVSMTKNPYTYMLLKCLPGLAKTKLETIPGEPPDMLIEFNGCAFSNRCKFSSKGCLEKKPSLMNISDGHKSRCLRIGEINFNE